MATTNTQFAIAVHILAAIGGKGGSTTSAQIAESVNTSPSFIRRTLSLLSKAGLIETVRGPGGCCTLARHPREITLLEIYQAVEAPKVFTLHQYPAERSCRVSCKIKSAMSEVLAEAQSVMEKSLHARTLADVLKAVGGANSVNWG